MSQEFEVAREWFLSGRRLDMGELAQELSISRATLHRRIGSRDRLLGEILWSLSAASITRLWPACVGRGAAGVADFVSEYVRLANDSPPFRDFLRREPERALRLLSEARGYLHGLDQPDDQVETWFGMRPCTPDTLPVIGFSGKTAGLIYATGHGMLGITLAAATGFGVAQLALDRRSSLDLEPFSARRYGL